MIPTFSCLIATCGSEAWEELAWSRAFQSARAQGFNEVVIQHHADLSVVAARNRTLADADSDYVVFLDADDELEPGYVDALKGAWIRGGITTDWRPLLAPVVRYVRIRQGVLSSSAAEIPNRGHWPRMNECVIGTAIPRLRLLELGGFDDWPAWEDWATFLKLAATGSQIEYVENAVYRAHVSSGGRNQVENGPRLHHEIVVAHREWAERAGVTPLL